MNRMLFPHTITLLILGILFSKLDNSQSEELYLAIKKGDQDAFKKFYNSQFESLYFYVKKMGVQSDAAEDLIQKAFIYIWENRKNINPNKSLRSYLYRIAYTRTINYTKQKKTDQLLFGNYKVDNLSPLEILKHKELNQSLADAIQQMPEKRRIVFEHCFIHELTYRETAEILDLAPKTIENHMGLALRDIRKMLKPFLKD